MRHLIFGKLLSTRLIVNLIDIGAYYNPIHLFLAGDLCLLNILIIEPILDPLSVSIPCVDNNKDKRTHVLFLPITFRYYMDIKQMLPKPETVVCIGCDRFRIVIIIPIFEKYIIPIFTIIIIIIIVNNNYQLNKLYFDFEIEMKMN